MSLLAQSLPAARLFASSCLLCRASQPRLLCPLQSLHAPQRLPCLLPCHSAPLLLSAGAGCPTPAASLGAAMRPLCAARAASPAAGRRRLPCRRLARPRAGRVQAERLPGTQVPAGRAQAVTTTRAASGPGAAATAAPPAAAPADTAEQTSVACCIADCRIRWELAVEVPRHGCTQLGASAVTPSTRAYRGGQRGAQGRCLCRRLCCRLVLLCDVGVLEDAAELVVGDL
ncbi:hypothetical protein ABPG75_011759 [Micractinium tetrahymenae]